jgi:prepilin-type N-terminal cleavage/methylation domain-containing protein
MIPIQTQAPLVVEHDSAAQRLIAFRSSAPPTRRRTGFTLIELLIVVVIIGILAAIAIPKFQATKGKAYYAGMRSDLRNLATSEEAYFYDHAQYSSVLDSVQFTPSKGDTVVITEATPTGWSATSINAASYPHFCAMFLGTAAAVPPATAQGIVACN